MTFEQRMAELGVDLSDIGERQYDQWNYLYGKYYDECEAEADTKGIRFDALIMISRLIKEIATMNYIIDRMETRIVNVTGERDYSQGETFGKPE